jgi:glycosyltransferase involved in cell wall biosynthesis
MSFHLLLAMALERPVVATSIPNISAIVESNASGLLVRPGDTQALASAIMRIWHDAQLRITVSLNARTRVSQRFELRRWQHDTAACYRVRT